MDEFGKKIAAILDEAPLEKRIEDRLAQSRRIALERMKQNNFIEVNQTPSEVINLKSKFGLFNENLKWLVWLAVGVIFIVLQQGYMYSNNESEIVQYLSNDYMQYKEKLNLEQESFDEWKAEINDLIDKEDN